MNDQSNGEDEGRKKPALIDDVKFCAAALLAHLILAGEGQSVLLTDEYATWKVTVERVEHHYR